MSHVLIVEDEIHIQRLTRLVLEKAGYTVETSSSGEAAIKICSNPDAKFDLILLDIMMPGIDGLQVLRTVKQIPHTSVVPVIMLTAIAQEAVVLKGIQLGAKDYIRKPFHPTDLLDRIKKTIEQNLKQAV
ncbi:MAG: response regulator [Proteobacteria bacterium]|nr:response regulator [Pseudomonadota bacterium]